VKTLMYRQEINLTKSVPSTISVLIPMDSHQFSFLLRLRVSGVMGVRSTGGGGVGSRISSFASSSATSSRTFRYRCRAATYYPTF